MRIRISYLIILFLVISHSLSSQKIFVDVSANGANDGNSWQDAYTDLHAALDTATTGDTICIAEGTYIPSEYPDQCVGCDSPRDYTFVIPDGVTILGSFPAGGGTVQSRDGYFHRTILSGDIGEDSDHSNNAYHVLLAVGLDNPSTLDHVNVVDGNANGTGSVMVQPGPEEIPRDLGGGVYCHMSQLRIDNCFFDDDRGTMGGGCYFANSDPVIRFSYFIFCSADDGGAIYFTNCNPIVYSTEFTINDAEQGGAVYNFQSAPLFFQSVFVANPYATHGACIFNSDSNLRLINNTLSGNAGLGGEPIYNLNSNLYITNSILWDNSIDEIVNSGSSTASVNYTNIKGGYAGMNNSDLDPIFAGAPSDLRLAPCSPLINKGINDSLPQLDTFDRFMNPRVVGDTVDLGVMEVQGNRLAGGSVIYVDSSATGSGDGSNWSDATPSLYNAILAAYACGVDTIKVAKGTYYPLNPTFDIGNTDGLVILGGYPAGGGPRDWVGNPTIMSGIHDFSPFLDKMRAWHTVYVSFTADDLLLDGFTIRDGQADHPVNEIDRLGAALLVEGSVTLRNVIITGNESIDGTPVYVAFFASLEMFDSIITGNDIHDGPIFQHSNFGVEILLGPNTVIEE